MAQGRRRLRDEAEMEVAVDRFHVGFDRDRARSDEGPDLGCEVDRAVIARCVQQRLLTKAITHQQQLLARRIPDRGRERPAQAMHEILAMAFIQEWHDFAVAAGAKACAVRREFLLQLDVVVDLAIDDGNCSIALTSKGLRAA